MSPRSCGKRLTVQRKGQLRISQLAVYIKTMLLMASIRGTYTFCAILPEARRCGHRHAHDLCPPKGLRKRPLQTLLGRTV